MSNHGWDGGCWIVLDRNCRAISGYHHRCEADAHAAALPLGFHVRRVECGCSKPEPPSCAHCGEPITGRWVGPIPKTGRLRDPHAAPVYHLDRPACRNAPRHTDTEEPSR